MKSGKNKLRARRVRRPNGVILYAGPSMLDGQPIVVIAVGLNKTTTNKLNQKTGPLLQTYILRSDMDPVTAIKLGADRSICGNCGARGELENGTGRLCYVNVGQGVLVVFKAYMRGRYAMGPQSLCDVGRGRKVRLGTYGDPAAVPEYVWRQLVAEADGHTGYTHQWRTSPHLRDLCMASVDSVAEATEAVRLGWRYFRVTFPGDLPRLVAERPCPASKEARVHQAEAVTCADCMLCHGRRNGQLVTQQRNVVIAAHGGFATMANVARRFANIPVVIEAA